MQAHAIEAPRHREARFDELMGQMKSLQGQSLAAAIPRELYEPRLVRGMLGLFTSCALWAGAIIGVALAPHPLLYIPLWLLAGLGGWGLHCIAHDCGHGSFSRSQRLNSVIGHLSLLPLVYPFHAWKHVHNLHHANTNSLKKDTDWRPVDALTFQRMPLLDKLIYMGSRSVFFWMATVHYWLATGFRPGFFPQAKARAEVRRSIVYVVLFSAVFFPALVYATGWMGLLKYFVGPWLGIHVWFSTTTFMHHTTEDIPFLRQSDWSPMGSKLLLTTDYRYPKFLLFLTHNISIHAAHHVAPKVPFYNLLQAQDALKASYPGMLREKGFSSIPRELFRALTRCHLYDPETGYYHSFIEKPGATVEASTIASS